MIKQCRFMLLCGITGLLASGATARAQYTSEERLSGFNNSWSEPRYDPSRVQRPPASISNAAGRWRGQVNQVHSVTLQDRAGQEERHTVARLFLEDGRRFWVDFGRNTHNRHAELRNGDYITVWGDRGRINGRPVVMVDQYRVMGRDMVVTRSDDRERQPDSEKSMLFNGRVADVQMVSLYEPDGPNTCLRLGLQNGRTLLINLGVPSYRARLDLDQGDNVTVRGRRFYVKGQPVIQAERLWINDQEVRLHQAGQERGNGLFSKMP